MNKHQAHQRTHYKPKYDRQRSITTANKKHHIAAQIKFAAKQQAKRKRRAA
jgi:hypothetical protein